MKYRVGARTLKRAEKNRIVQAKEKLVKNPHANLLSSDAAYQMDWALRFKSPHTNEMYLQQTGVRMRFVHRFYIGFALLLAVVTQISKEDSLL